MDIADRVLSLAEAANKKCVLISLGRGQDVVAEETLAVAVDRGFWVCLQNCHLAPAWLPKLSQILTSVTDDVVDPEFRLLLLTRPTPALPSPLLQRSHKLTVEAHTSVRGCLVSTARAMCESERAAHEMTERRIASGVAHAAAAAGSRALASVSASAGAESELVGGRAEGRLHLLPARVLEPVEFVDARAIDDSEHRLRLARHAALP